MKCSRRGCVGARMEFSLKLSGDVKYLSGETAYAKNQKQDQTKSEGDIFLKDMPEF